MSLRSKLKDKLLGTHLSESVTEKLHHLIGDNQDEKRLLPKYSPSPSVSLNSLDDSINGNVLTSFNKEPAVNSLPEKTSNTMPGPGFSSSTMVLHPSNTSSASSVTGPNSATPMPGPSNCNSTKACAFERGSAVSLTSRSRSGSFEVIESGELARSLQQNELYEQQMTLLQEQLVSTMIDNQNMAAELEAIKGDAQSQLLAKELEYEKKKNNELILKISEMAQQPATSHQRTSSLTREPKISGETSGTSEQDIATQDSTTMSYLERIALSLLNKYYEVLEDFAVTADDVELEQPVEPLAVKTLKQNVKRFSSGVEPLFDTLDGLNRLFMWQTPLLTGSLFALYMYACWEGILIPLLLFLLALRLILNLLEEWKIIPPVVLLPQKVKNTEEEKDTSVSDKFNIVLQVATKVQNTLGGMANNLEKMNNLLTWKQVDCTKKIFIPVCVVCVLSSFLSLDTLVTYLGFLLGIKLFAVDPIYKRFPRVKAKYDTSSQLWSDLMTDAELEKQRKVSANKKIVLSRSFSGKKLSSQVKLSEELTEDDRDFCDKFHLPYEERPSKNSMFKSGRNCIYMEKGASLKLATAYNNHAKIYLTPNFLCYELLRTEERHSIPLPEITRVDKTKAVSFLPGNGMAIEVAIQGFDKPHIFGGLHHRDQCFDELIKAGKATGCSYADRAVKTDLRLSDLEGSV